MKETTAKLQIADGKTKTPPAPLLRGEKRRQEKPPLLDDGGQKNYLKINLSIMSKIIYRKIRTAPGVKQYLDEEKTQVNPQFEANSAYYAQAVTIETMSLRDMAKHITSHGSPFTMDVVIGVLEAFRSCLIEQLLESKKVKVQGLGTFYVTIANKEGGIKNLEDFNIGTLATGLRLRFLPEGATEESISSKDFLKKASFVDVATLTKTQTVSDEETDENEVNGNGGNTGGNSGGNNGGGTLVDDPDGD